MGQGVHASGNTTITVYGGTDYDLANSAISANAYSMMKSPQGFPMSPAKWTEETTDTTARRENTPSAGTWYNTGSINITIPIGIWEVYYECFVRAREDGETTAGVRACLSTANNSASDNAMIAEGYSSNSEMEYGTTLTRRAVIGLTTKGVYYMNIGTRMPRLEYVEYRNDLATLVIRATCAYL